RRPVGGAGNTHLPMGDPPTKRRFPRETEFRPSVSVGDSHSSIQRLHLQRPRHRPTAPKSQRRPFRSAQSRTAIACPCHFLLPEIRRTQETSQRRLRAEATCTISYADRRSARRWGQRSAVAI